ncbi:MAG: hypothetical protein HYU66_09635 [Armatimonadetes bacterium]|nr:hypothetical protein [Armatimonadota bacterium]
MYRWSHLALVLVAGPAALPAAPASYQPSSSITRGIYADLGDALSTRLWEPWGAFELDRATAHGGTQSVRCVGEAGGTGQGVSQQVFLDQTEPKPIRIAGWSRAEGVAGSKGWQYSLYVDFVYNDDTSWVMQVAPFGVGSHDWEYSEVVVKPAKPVHYGRFHAFIRQLPGTVWFDDLFLGEEGGENLLRGADFEGGLRDMSRREAFYGRLADLHVNALHGYLGGGMKEWDTPADPANPLREFLDDAQRRGIGVWLTLGVGTRPFKDADDPSFPQYYCPNETWGADWTAAVARAARFPFSGISMVPDEYNLNNGDTDSLRKHSDKRVADFYTAMGEYCNGPGCRAGYERLTGHALPDVTRGPRDSAEAYRCWVEFRYDTTTAWLARTVKAVKAANPGIRTDSLICVTPLCSDLWWGPGVAWDRAGYEAGVEYPTTDPYIELHNYLGDSNHWYVTETTEHLAGASPARRCGVVLEASRLRPEYRELDPVETYGSALSAVWHGARELAWWHFGHITDRYHSTDQAAACYARVQGVYALLERIDPWFRDARPAPGIAFLFSRASCDAWRLYASDEHAPAGVLTHANRDPRYASLAQKELLSYLFRQGYPVTLYYLESVRAEELAAHPVVVVPFAYAIADGRMALLRRLAESGKHVVIVSELGLLDEHGTPRAKPALLDPCALPVGAVPSRQAVGKGTVTFVPGEIGYRVVLNRDNEKRSRSGRIPPGELDPQVTKVWQTLLKPWLGEPWLNRPVQGDDAEVVLRRSPRGWLLLCVNWRDEPVRVAFPHRAPFGRASGEVYALGPDGRMVPAKLAAGRYETTLSPQQALVALLPAR